MKQVYIYPLKRRFFPLKPVPFCGRGPRVTPIENPFPLVTPRRYGDCVVGGGGPGSLFLNPFPGSLSLEPLLPGSLSLNPLPPGSLSLKPLLPGSLFLNPLLPGSLSLNPLLLGCSGPRGPFGPPPSPFNRWFC